MRFSRRYNRPESVADLLIPPWNQLAKPAQIAPDIPCQQLGSRWLQIPAPRIILRRWHTITA